MKHAINLLFLIGALGCEGSGQEARSPGSSTSTTASDFSTRGMDGSTIRLGDHLGKKTVLLVFFRRPVRRAR